MTATKKPTEEQARTKLAKAMLKAPDFDFDEARLFLDLAVSHLVKAGKPVRDTVTRRADAVKAASRHVISAATAKDIATAWRALDKATNQRITKPAHKGISTPTTGFQLEFF